MNIIMIEALLKAKKITEEQAQEMMKSEKAEKKTQNNSSSNNQNHKAKTNHQNNGRSNNYNQGVNNRAGNFNNNIKATAPYHFVTLPQAVLTAELADNINNCSIKQDELNGKFKEFIQEKGVNSGYLDLNIETLTPLFIGGEKTSDSFNVNGTPIIPGSSIRGMIKNIFKIITCGAMRAEEDFNDGHLYFRALMAPNKDGATVKKLHDYYVDNMSEKTGDKITKKTKGGFILRKKGKYYIAPATNTPQEFGGNIKEQPKACFEMFEKDKSANIFTGYALDRKKPKTKFQVLSNAKWDDLIEVDEAVIRDYENDKNRKGINLLTDKNTKRDGAAAGFCGLKDVDLIAPCFYVIQDEVVRHFGHGRSYRIPYNQNIGGHIPQNLQTETIDFADAVFGKKGLWASRLSFEDAVIVQSSGYEDEDYSHPLMSPNPTSFQLYLKQDNPNLMKHWDDDVDIRGYKMYWHKNFKIHDWKISPQEKPVKGQEKIRPIKAGNKFRGRINFNNLTDVELGALLKVFNLTTERSIGYKLGKGKPLGLGSVKIKAELKLMNNKERYGKLFSNNSWVEGLENADKKDYIKNFQEFIDKKLTSTEKSYYELVLSELMELLDLNQENKFSDWKDKTEYMRIDDDNRRFIRRVPLPTVKEVVKK